MYSLTTGLAMAYMHDHTMDIVASAVYLVGEVVYRLYSIRHLRRLKSWYVLHEQAAPEDGIETEDDGAAVDEIFPNPIPNVHHDVRRENLVLRPLDRPRRFE